MSRMFPSATFYGLRTSYGQPPRRSQASKGYSLTEPKRPSDPTNRHGQQQQRREAHDSGCGVGRNLAQHPTTWIIAPEPNRHQSNFTRQARDDHSAGGNAEDGDGAPKRNPKGAGVRGQGSPREWLCSVIIPSGFASILGFCA